MWFGMIALIVFLLAIIFFIFIRMVIAHHYKNLGKAEWQLLYFIDTHKIYEVTEGPLAEFLETLRQHHGMPQTKLFTFAPHVDFVAIKNQLPKPLQNVLPASPMGPFTYILQWGSAKFSIFFPEQWLNNGLSAEASLLVICHEAGHIIYRRRSAWLGRFYYIYSLFSRRHARDYFDEKLYEKKDSWANAFSAKVIGKEKSIQLLEEIRENLKRNRWPIDPNQDNDLHHHIAEIRETIRQQNPLKIT